MSKKIPDSKVGKVYRGRTKYIDKDTKPERDFVVVSSKGKLVRISKLKTIKQFDEYGRNADKALVEINHKRYGLPRRTGVDYEKFSQNRMSKNALRIDDKDVFPNQKEEFELSKRDLDKVLYHTGEKNRRNQKKKKK